MHGYKGVNMKSQVKQSNNMLKIFLSVMILIISLRYIGKVYQPTLLDDEFAYFGIARYFPVLHGLLPCRYVNIILMDTVCCWYPL